MGASVPLLQAPRVREVWPAGDRPAAQPIALPPQPGRLFAFTLDPAGRVLLFTAASRHADAVSSTFPTGHRVDKSMRHWTSLLGTYKQCRFSKELSTRAGLNCDDARCLTAEAGSADRRLRVHTTGNQNPAEKATASPCAATRP